MNIQNAQDILRTLADTGLRTVALCPGARNAPFVASLACVQDLQVETFFDERAAAFWALGVCRREQRPVAIITTSGTAVAELFPAVIEADHIGFPIVLLTADRPRRLRGSGAPQAIDQDQIFGKFVEKSVDIESESLDLSFWSKRRPLHINVCFDEPLIDQNVETWNALRKNNLSPEDHSRSQHFFQDAPSTQNGELLEEWKSFLSHSQKPLVLVGSLDFEEEREVVLDFLLRLSVPVYLEGTSGLRGDPRLKSLALQSGDRGLLSLLRAQKCDGVLRLGGVPTARLWRDLDLPNCPWPVLSISRLPYSGLSRGRFVPCELPKALPHLQLSQGLPFNREIWSEFDQPKSRELQALLEKFPRSEPSLVAKLARLVREDELIYVGNSLPIREWDLAVDYDRALWVRANRGVNGIDGQLSSFIGQLAPHESGWAVVGDLTALYDLSAPWALGFKRGKKINARARMIILNNGGGKIFNRIFGAPIFENQHTLEFSHWAAMWSLPYQRWVDVPQQLPQDLNDSCVVELVPDADQTSSFWSEHEKMYGSIWP